MNTTQPGALVNITSPDDNTDVMHEGVCRYVTADGWVGVQVLGETVTHEWPQAQVWTAA